MGDAEILYRVSYGIVHSLNAFPPRLNLKWFGGVPMRYFDGCSLCAVFHGHGLSWRHAVPQPCVKARPGQRSQASKDG